MKIINFNSFIEFAKESETKYKFYRVLGDKIQLIIAGRDGWIHSDTENMDNKKLLKLLEMGFVEVQLTKEEEKEWGLE